MFDILSPKWDEHISGDSFVTLSNLIQMVYFGIFTLNKRYNFVYTDGINDYTFCIDILSYWVVVEGRTTYCRNEPEMCNFIKCLICHQMYKVSLV